LRWEILTSKQGGTANQQYSKQNLTEKMCRFSFCEYFLFFHSGKERRKLSSDVSGDSIKLRDTLILKKTGSGWWCIGYYTNGI